MKPALGYQISRILREIPYGLPPPGRKPSVRPNLPYLTRLKIIATKGHILRQKFTKFDFGWGSAPDPTGGAYNARTVNSAFAEFQTK